LGRRSVCKT